jgi:hypothetical protein
VKVNPASQQTTLFPWVDAAGDGGVDIVYYGTTSNVNDTGATWNVFMSQTLAGHTGTPTFSTTQITGGGGNDPIHEGNISTGGLQPTGAADRSLADLFQVAIDYHGLANISWTADWYDRGDPSNTGDGQAWFTHQTAGAIAGVPNDGCHSFNGGATGGTGAKITGGGFIAGRNGGKANFGFNEQQLGGGNLTYIDKGADVSQFKADTSTPPTVTAPRRAGAARGRGSTPTGPRSPSPTRSPSSTMARREGTTASRSPSARTRTAVS